MTVEELVDKLQKFQCNQEITILDGFNGGGYPRTINFGPVTHILGEKDIVNNTDMEEIGKGKSVVLIGFGCY